MQDDESEVAKATNTADDPVGVGPLDRELTPDEFVDVLNQFIERKRIEENQRTQLSSIRQRVRKLLYGEEENRVQLTLRLTHNLDVPSAEAYANFEEALGRMAALTHDQAPSPSGASLEASYPLRILRSILPELTLAFQPFCLSGLDGSFFFLPDCIFQWDGMKYRLYPHASVQFRVDCEYYTDQLYQHVTRKGLPDKRYKTNLSFTHPCWYMPT